VARSLNSSVNMWDIAKPVVEDYIRENLGPKAVARDMARTARVFGRYGSRMPEIVEALLERQLEQPEPPPPPSKLRDVGLVATGGGLVALGVLLAGLL